MWVHGTPDDLRAAIDKEGEEYNERPHEALKNVCPNDVYAGRKDEVLEQRAKIKLETMARRYMRTIWRGRRNRKEFQAEKVPKVAEDVQYCSEHFMHRHPDGNSPLIDSPSFCMLPWTHMSVSPEGGVAPCCNSTLSFGELEGDSLEGKWNSEAMKALRLDMLAGREIPTCSACALKEKVGADSARRWANRSFARHSSEVFATRPDGGLPRMRWAYMDVRFSNVCNFRCRTCRPQFSSSWHQDAKRMTELSRSELGIFRTRMLRPMENPVDLWRQIEPLLPHLEMIRFQGGEPLIMKEHYQILDALLQKSMFHVRLIYNTNFSITRYQGRDVMKLWDRFQTVNVCASLDASGRRGEYMRKGQSWQQVIANRKRLSATCPRVTFQIAPTLGVMNSLHLPDFHREWIEAGHIRPTDIHINYLISPKFYRTQILPAPIKRRVAEKYQAHIDGYLGPMGEGGRQDADCFRAAIGHMMAEDCSGELETFKARTRELDALRGENFTDVFPELAELMR